LLGGNGTLAEAACLAAALHIRASVKDAAMARFLNILSIFGGEPSGLWTTLRRRTKLLVRCGIFDAIKPKLLRRSARAADLYDRGSVQPSINVASAKIT
jgi:hypothetical protein